MASENKKILVVFGATGIQGGSVAREILSDAVTAQKFHVRAITRDPSKPAALALAEQGAELVKGDMEDRDSLRQAIKNAYAVFAVTNFWDTMSAVAETRQGKNVADIAKELDVKHLVWSSLPNVSQLSGTKLTGVSHWDGKAQVDDYIRSISVPHTIVHLGTYTSFLLESLVPLSATPPSYGIFFPEPSTAKTALPLLDPTADLGKFVKAILLNPDKSLGRQINVAEKFYTMEEILKALENQGLNVMFQVIDKETFKAGLASKGLPESFQIAMAELVQFIAEYGVFGGANLEEGHQLVTEPLTPFEVSLKNSAAFAALAK